MSCFFLGQAFVTSELLSVVVEFRHQCCSHCFLPPVVLLVDCCFWLAMGRDPSEGSRQSNSITATVLFMAHRRYSFHVDH